MSDTEEATALQEAEALAVSLDEAIWTSEGSIPVDEIESQQSLATFLRRRFDSTTRRSA
ncbi:hypothetical protein [Leifsonia sp. P73]|uniref:hypothetical protein n=1 Tax=Leifsonia sp. P73 TaxID=3423959 RepID=UPI003DA50A70